MGLGLVARAATVVGLRLVVLLIILKVSMDHNIYLLLIPECFDNGGYTNSCHVACIGVISIYLSILNTYIPNACMKLQYLCCTGLNSQFSD